MSGLLLRLRAWWETVDRTQRVVTMFGTGFFVLLIFGTFYFASRPKLDILYGGLAQEDKATVMDELRKQGVAAEYDRQGNILVPSNMIEEARSKLAIANKLPSSGHGGYSDLASMSMMSTPSVERERLKAALEGELAKTIETFEGVSSARVHLTPGNDSPFETEKKPAMASVGITEKQRGAMSASTGSAIARLVASAVPGLEPKSVTVMTSRGTVLWDGRAEEGVDGRADRKLQAEIAESSREQQLLQVALDRAFGPGNTVAMVQVELDFDKSDVTTNEERTGSDPLVQESSTETYGDSGAPGGATSGGIAAPAISGATAGLNGGYSGKTEYKTFPKTQTTTVTQKAVGKIISKTINVLADETKIKDTTPIEQFLAGQLGSKSDQAGFTFAVTKVPFDREAEKTAEKESAAAAGGQKMQQYLGLLPVIALILVAFIVLKAIGKATSSKDVLVKVSTSAPGVILEGGGESVGALTSGQAAYSTARAQQLAANPQALDQGPRELQFIRADSIEPIDAIAEKVNVPLEQLKKMAADRPDSVAMLLKTWILEGAR